MKQKSHILCFLFILILGTMLFGCGDGKSVNEGILQDEDKLIVFTSHKEDIYEPIIKEFEDRSGIWVQVVQGGTNELLEQIVVNGEYGCADVMFGGGVDSLSVYEDYFEPYQTSQYEKLDGRYASKNDSYTVFSKLPIVFVYNEKLVIKAGIPRSFNELLQYRWKGRVAFANPVSSGSSYTALTTMLQVLDGEMSEREVIQSFLDILDGDICENSGDVIDLVISGEKIIGITLESAALKKIKAGESIGIIYPSDGTSTVPDGCAIIKNAPHKKNAQLFVEFIVSDDAQHLLEERLDRRSVRKDIEIYAPVVEMDYDIDYAISHRADILSLWNEIAGGKR